MRMFERTWTAAVLLLACVALVGCAGPTFTLTHQPALDTARGKMFELTAGGARVASLEVPLGTVQDTPTPPPTDTPEPAVGAQAQPVDFEDRFSKIEERVAALEQTCKQCEEWRCKCPPLAGASSPGGPAPASSPAVDWPPGCHVEIWTAPGCEPCKRWEADEAPKLPATAYTIRDTSLEDELATAKRVPSCPYYILTETATKKELLRISGFVTAEYLAKRATEKMAPSVSSSNTGDTAYVASLRTHMLTTHGRDCSSMTEAELEAAHNAAHGVSYGTTYYPGGMPAQQTGTRLVRYVSTSSRGNNRVRLQCRNCR